MVFVDHPSTANLSPQALNSSYLCLTIFDFTIMAGLNAIQRTPGAPLPKTDAQLAREAYQFVNRQVKKYRERRQLKAQGGSASQDPERGSMISRADTLVEESDEETKNKKIEKEMKPDPK